MDGVDTRTAKALLHNVDILRAGRRPKVRLNEPLTVQLQNGDWLTVPAGFVTDLASTPILVWPILPPWDEYARAAVVHDYLFRTGKYGWAFSNKAMLHLMKEDGVDWWKQRFVFRGLQIGSLFTWWRYCLLRARDET